MQSFYELISAKTIPSNNDVAIIESNLNKFTYADLFHKTEALEKELTLLNLTEGSSIILKIDKTFNSLAYIICCIKMGVIYIPIDESSTVERTNKIIETSRANAILNPDYSINIISTTKHEFEPTSTCILFTSGSTGTPKGVVISSAALSSFVKWGVEEFKINSNDTLTAYAPFHFDLSTFDLFAGLASGASIWLINQQLGANFRLIGEQIKTIKPTVWYATPTVFTLLQQYGKLPNDYSPRLALFAGEVFPIANLNLLRGEWRDTIFYNLYGPTETNVCTYYKLPKEIEPNRTSPYPIGVNCPYITTKIDNNNELLVSGLSLMLGYINNETATHEKLITEDNVKWYKTGDIVETIDSQLIYKGRVDRMVKRRGFRIELGEIENALNQNPLINNSALVTIERQNEIKIIAFYSDNKLSSLALKAFCSEKLLNYMIPDEFIFLEKMPFNKNGKIDYQQLIINFSKHE